VADVLTVAAVELGDPVAVLILVVTDDAPLQMPSVQAEGQIVFRYPKTAGARTCGFVSTTLPIADSLCADPAVAKTKDNHGAKHTCARHSAFS
jgi:hypothetical protein